MKFQHQLIFIVLISCSFCFGQNTDVEKTADSLQINDGPYVFIYDDSLVEETIINGLVTTKSLDSDSYSLKYKSHSANLKNVEKLVALSDIHGQYDLAIELLTNNKIIDKNLNWNYGTGHLIIAGDIFDRGDKVNEVLWFIYKLEQQAIKAGGMVHYILGNHEYMILLEDYRYVNKKYLLASSLLNKSYKDLYGQNTVLGRWIRSKNTVVKINDKLFLHGGISKDFIDSGYRLNTINKQMIKAVDDESMLSSKDFFNKYYGPNSPIWYRGYFYDDLPVSQIDSILNSVKTDHIIVGHCSFDTIVRRYDGKIYGVDSSIKLGQNGELLFIESGKFTRGLLDGSRVEFEDRLD